MTHLTTHVLDAAAGSPAVGVDVSLARQVAEGDAESVARGVTDADGRLALGPDTLEPGTYALTFGTGAYFAARDTPTFYPVVTVTFTVDDTTGHHHVPLLLSPFAYSTYRGS